MRRLLFSLILCALGLQPALAQATSAREQLPLSAVWSFRQLPGDGMREARASTSPSAEGTWMPAVVPGDVHLDLLRNGLIPDPFFRDNESRLAWVEKAGWEYRTAISPSASTLARKHLELVFDGLDTACTVFLNGTRIAQPDNMFRQWRVGVRGRLHAGANDLRIVFPAPMAAAEAVAARDPWHSRTHTDPKGYIRKAVYEFGWDWGPRFATSGVYRRAYLDVWDDVRIEGIFVEQVDVTAAAAHVDVHADILSAKAGSAAVTLRFGLGTATQSATRTVTLGPGKNRISFPLDLPKPRLWFPAGYGAQPLYSFDVSLRQGGTAVDHKETKAGLRSVVLHRELDAWGRSFEFVVNGIPIFAKGADVIPFDSFPNRVSDASYRHILQSAKDANMNMVRLWGGGYYESDEFYNLCDELGLMVWHDLMFGNNWQPGTYDFKQNIAAEAEYQMTRLRNHPSIVLWSGNNETELLRDWNGNGELPPPVHERIWQDYLTEFSGVLATAAARLAPQVPYWPSSPSADYEELSDAYQSGDNHDWTVWHGKQDFAAYGEHHWRFVSEFGFQSFPEMKTVESFTLPEDRTGILSPVMLVHQKNMAGNDLIREYMLRYYGEPRDFPSFLYASQVLQAEGVKAGAEGWRRARPRTMGTIFWQLNDCWPVASWSSIDYAGRWKALQFYARRFYAPVLVSPVKEEGALAIYLVSDHTTQESGTLAVRVLKFDGTVVSERSAPVNVRPLASTRALSLPLAELLPSGTRLNEVVVVAELRESGRLVSQNLLYLAPTKEITLPAPAIEASLSRQADGYAVRLRSEKLARSVLVSFGENDATFSDNFVDLLPNTPVELHLTSAASLETLQRSLRTQSLADAFLRTALSGSK